MTDACSFRNGRNRDAAFDRLAGNGAELVAFEWLQTAARHRGFVRSMYVSPRSRGSGVGRALLREAILVASNWSGLEQLTLAVTAGNESALALYLEAGFIECGRFPQALCVDGVYYEDLQMFRHFRAA